MESNEVIEWYIEKDTDILTVKMIAETLRGFKFDLEIKVDRQNQTYSYIDNPHYENEKIKNENQISNEEIEAELANKVVEILRGLYMMQRLINDPKYKAYTESIRDWLRDE